MLGLTAADVAAEDEPALSADGRRIELSHHAGDHDGGTSSVSFCNVGAEVDRTCTWFHIPYSYSGEGGPYDSTPIEKAIQNMRKVGGFQPLRVIPLHRIADDGEDFAPQRVKWSRVTATSGDVTITVATSRRKASIVVTRAKRTIATASWGCVDTPRDQPAIVGAVTIGSDKPVVYARLSCLGSTEWRRVPSR